MMSAANSARSTWKRESPKKGWPQQDRRWKRFCWPWWPLVSSNPSCPCPSCPWAAQLEFVLSGQARPTASPAFGTGRRSEPSKKQQQQKHNVGLNRLILALSRDVETLLFSYRHQSRWSFRHRIKDSTLRPSLHLYKQSDQSLVFMQSTCARWFSPPCCLSQLVCMFRSSLIPSSSASTSSSSLWLSFSIRCITKIVSSRLSSISAKMPMQYTAEDGVIYSAVSDIIVSLHLVVYSRITKTWNFIGEGITVSQIMVPH